ncbi:MAG: acyltransferase [Oscillospiraceae bacterium]
MKYKADQSAIIENGAVIGDDTRIWHFSHLREGSRIGKGCNIGQNVYVDKGVIVGNYCKIQNNVNLYKGVRLEDYVFCGPSMTFTNVKYPRCLFPKEVGGEYYLPTVVKYGATIGAGAVVVCGTTIGKHAMIGSGAVVTKDVEDYSLVMGNPAKQVGWVCECGEILTENMYCKICGKAYELRDRRIKEV